MRLGSSRRSRMLLILLVWVALLACGSLAAGSTAALAKSLGVGPDAVAPAAATPDVWFTVTPTSEYGKVSSSCTTPCLTVTYTTQYHYGPSCGFPVNFYWDKTYPAGGGQVAGYTGCTTPKTKQLQIDGVTYGTHQICAIPYPTSPSDPVIVKCVTFHVLKSAPKPTPTPKPTPKPTAAPTPTASPSPSPSPTDVAIPTPTALALVSASPTPSPSTTPGASPTLDLSGAGGASDLTPIFVGGAIFLVLLVGIVIGMVRRARVLPPPR